MVLFTATLFLVCHDGKMSVIFSHKWDLGVHTFRTKRTLLIVLNADSVKCLSTSLTSSV